MLKNLFLNASAMFHSPDENGNPTPAELERDAIELTELKPKEGENKDDKSEQSGDDKENNESGETVKDKSEEKEEVEEVEAVVETPEEKAIREADEAASADNKSKRQVDRMQKRIDTLTAKSRTTETENAELKKLLDAKNADGTLTLTEDEVERRAELKAEAKLLERQFNRAVSSLAEGANKLDKEFNKNIKVMTDEIGLLPPVMIGILEDLEVDDKKIGPEVLVYLSKNVDEYEDIWQLGEGRMALKLQKIAEKIVKKPAKRVSQVPPPNEAVGGKRASVALNDTMTDEQWIAQREAQLKAKRA